MSVETLQIAKKPFYVVYGLELTSVDHDESCVSTDLNVWMHLFTGRQISVLFNTGTNKGKITREASALIQMFS